MLFWQQVHLLMRWTNRTEWGRTRVSSSRSDTQPVLSFRDVLEASTGQLAVTTATQDGQYLPAQASALASHISHFPQCACLTHVSAFFVPMTLTLHVFHISFFVSQELPLQQLKRLNTAQPKLSGGEGCRQGGAKTDPGTRGFVLPPFPVQESTCFYRLPSHAIE